MKAVTFHIRDKIALETQNGLAYFKEWENSEPFHIAQPGPFQDIIGDGIFDDSDEDNDGQQFFDFNDLIPILEEDDEGYDLEAAFRRYEFYNIIRWNA